MCRHSVGRESNHDQFDLCKCHMEARSLSPNFLLKTENEKAEKLLIPGNFRTRFPGFRTLVMCAFLDCTP